VEEGVLTIAAGENVLRIVPPLVVSEADVSDGLACIRRAALRHHVPDTVLRAAGAR
jgi:acetylornithine/N-succinyldiaminopimelate aminotransferase